MNWQRLKSIFLHEPSMYLFFCTGLMYGMFFWPLASSVFSISLAVYWLLFSNKIPLPGRSQTALALLFISLFLVTALGLLNSANLVAGVSRLQRQLPILLFPVVFAFSRTPDRQFSTTILGHYLAALILVIIAGFLHGLFVFHGDIALMTTDGGNLVFPKSYPYVLALQSLLGLVLLGEKTVPAYFRRRGTRLIFFAVIAAYILLLNVRLLSGLCVLLIVYYACRRIPRKRFQLAAAVLLLAVAGFLVLRTPSLSEKWNELIRLEGKGTIPLDTNASLGRDWGGAAIRIALWRSGRELLLRHPLTGVGIGDVQDSLQQAYRNHQFYFASEYNRYNIHNQYMNMVLAVGIGGLLVLLACIFCPLILLRGDMFDRVRMLFLIGFFLIGFTEVILDNSRGSGWYALLNAILVFGGKESETTKPVS